MYDYSPSNFWVFRLNHLKFAEDRIGKPLNNRKILYKNKNPFQNFYVFFERDVIAYMATMMKGSFQTVLGH